METLPRESGGHTATLFTSKIVQVCGYGEVEGGRKGGAEGRGCLGHGKAGAESMGLESLVFPLKPGRLLG